MDFESKSAIITGSAQGIGRGIALELASRGAHVLICDLDEAKIKSVVEEIQEAEGIAVGLKANVTTAAHVEQMTGLAIEAFGKIDILVNNVGGSGTADVDHIEEMDDELWASMMDINMKSMFLCSRAVAPLMKEKSYGKIVNISSMAAKGSFGPRGTAAARLPYAAAKAGVVGFTIQLAKDLGPFGIYVNAVMPRLILPEKGTRIYERYSKLTDRERERSVQGVPLGRRGSPEEVAKAVAFLASNEASYITGVVLEVAGGL